jgi:hypothetical protein
MLVYTHYELTAPIVGAHSHSINMPAVGAQLIRHVLFFRPWGHLGRLAQGHQQAWLLRWGWGWA